MYKIITIIRLTLQGALAGSIATGVFTHSQPYVFTGAVIGGIIILTFKIKNII